MRPRFSRPRRFRDLSGLRGPLSAALITVACLLAPFGTLAAWAAYGLADTGRYVAAMAPLASDPAVRGAVADAVGDGILAEVDAGPAHGAVSSFVHDAVRSFTGTETYRTAWDATNRAVHDAVLRALRDDHAAHRAVTVDLAPVAASVKAQLAAQRLPLARRIPVEHTAVAVLPADETDRLRKGYHVLGFAAFWLPLGAAVFALAGIGVAACRRRALAATALGTALGGALLALAVTIGRRLTVADLSDELRRPAVAAVYDALTTSLRTASWLLVTVGLAVAAASWLTGRDGRRRVPRQSPAPPAPPWPGGTTGPGGGPKSARPVTPRAADTRPVDAQATDTRPVDTRTAGPPENTVRRRPLGDTAARSEQGSERRP